MPGESISQIPLKATFVNGVTDLLEVSQATGNPSAPYVTKQATAGLVALSKAGVGVIFANLPSPPSAGMIYTVTDASSNPGWGANVTSGGGSTTLLVWYNGSHWTVLGQ